MGALNADQVAPAVQELLAGCRAELIRSGHLFRIIKLTGTVQAMFAYIGHGEVVWINGEETSPQTSRSPDPFCLIPEIDFCIDTAMGRLPAKVEVRSRVPASKLYRPFMLPKLLGVRLTIAGVVVYAESIFTRDSERELPIPVPSLAARPEVLPIPARGAVEDPGTLPIPGAAALTENE